MRMSLYPIFVDLRGRPVLVVGGGQVAARKVERLLVAGAKVRLVAPAQCNELLQRQARGEIEVLATAFTPEALHNQILVVAATSDLAVNRAVAAAAAARGMLVNVVDDPQLSSFQVPAVIDRGPLQIAISSGRSAPVLSHLLRARLETVLPPALGKLAAVLERCRGAVVALLPDVNQRRRWYERVLDSVGRVAQTAAPDIADRTLLEDATRFAHSAPARGHVSLVGAGSGDPDLLTLGGLRALQSADVILHDRLVGAGVIDLARRDALRIAVGKCAGGESIAQDRIHELMLEHARAGRHVVRLKGGDPFVFGRGGEELEFLVQHGIDFSVVPGVTAALACAAYAGIPLTHRDHAQSVRFLTAHCADSIDTLDWAALADDRQTLAIYMGVAGLGRLRGRLLAHGRKPETPLAIVENGSRPDQRVVIGNLNHIVELSRDLAIKSPALLIIGEVTTLAQRLHWFGAAPITRDTRRQPNRHCEEANDAAIQ